MPCYEHSKWKKIVDSHGLSSYLSFASPWIPLKKPSSLRKSFFAAWWSFPFHIWRSLTVSHVVWVLAVKTIQQNLVKLIYLYELDTGYPDNTIQNHRISWFGRNPWGTIFPFLFTLTFHLDLAFEINTRETSHFSGWKFRTEKVRNWK